MAKKKPKLDDSKDLIRVNTKKREIEKRDEYDVWANGLGLGVEERKVLEKLKGATGERIISATSIAQWSQSTLTRLP